MSVFKFKYFDVEQNDCAQKVGTDSMILGSFLEHKNPVNILDVGTGNGILALMAAQKFKTSDVVGVEIQSDCSAIAKYNFENSSYDSRLKVINVDFNKFIFSQKFDLIISNPPFFENALYSVSLDRTTARHQSKLKINKLIEIASGGLENDGALWLIVPREISDALLITARQNHLEITRKIKIFGKPDNHKRDILVFTKTSQNTVCENEEFTIRNLKGDYTEEYKARTFEFHHTHL